MSKTCPRCGGFIHYEGFSSVECVTQGCPNYTLWARDCEEIPDVEIQGSRLLTEEEMGDLYNDGEGSRSELSPAIRRWRGHVEKHYPEVKWHDWHDDLTFSLEAFRGAEETVGAELFVDHDDKRHSVKCASVSNGRVFYEGIKSVINQDWAPGEQEWRRRYRRRSTWSGASVKTTTSSCTPDESRGTSTGDTSTRTSA